MEKINPKLILDSTQASFWVIDILSCEPEFGMFGFKYLPGKLYDTGLYPTVPTFPELSQNLCWF